MPAFADAVGDPHVPLVGVASRGQPLAVGPADVEPGHVLHLEQAHREAEATKGCVHLPRRCPVLDQCIGRLAIGREDAISDEAVAVAGPDGELAEPSRKAEAGRYRLGRGAVGHHDLEQLHEVGGREEVQPDDVARPRRDGGDARHREIGRVGGQ